MLCHCGTNNRAPRRIFTDPCKPEVRPGAREESASPAWLAASAMNARDTNGIYGGLTLDVDRHYMGSVTATTHQEKGIITLESNYLINIGFCRGCAKCAYQIHILLLDHLHDIECVYTKNTPTVQGNTGNF